MAEDKKDLNLQHSSPSSSEYSTEISKEEDTVKPPGQCNVNETTINNGSKNKHEIDKSNLHYEGNVCVYTDPGTKYQYIWDSVKKEWKSRSDAVESREKEKTTSTSESKEQSNISITVPPCSHQEDKTSKSDYEFDGESYCYKDQKTGITYKYDNSKSTWVVKHGKESDVENDSDESDEDNKDDDGIKKQDMSTGVYGYEGDTHTYTDTTDGTVYLWDREKNAWFPKVDEDFLAHYQMNYGFTDTNTDPSAGKMPETENKKENNEESLGVKRKATPQEPSWFEMDDQHNTKVYVNNLPLDITEQEFVDVMQKCGLVMKDAETGKMKIKLYTEPGSNQLKGDGLCTYIKIESVDLALKLLDGSELRGHKLHVEKAKFQMKGNYDPNLKPKKRKKKEKEKLKKMQEKLFDWHPDKMRGERSKHEKVVIVKNLFDPTIFDKEVSLILEYQQDLREECSKCGDVRRVIIYDRHPEGVAQITFREPEEADACVTLLNGRWFGQRKISAESWDGKTKYKIAETDAEVQKRLQKWNKFLESGEVAAGKKEENIGKTSIVKREVTNENNKSQENIVSTNNEKFENNVVTRDSKRENTKRTENGGNDVIEEGSRSSVDTESHKSENKVNNEDSKKVGNE